MIAVGLSGTLERVAGANWRKSEFQSENGEVNSRPSKPNPWIESFSGGSACSACRLCPKPARSTLDTDEHCTSSPQGGPTAISRGRGAELSRVLVRVFERCFRVDQRARTPQ